LTHFWFIQQLVLSSRHQWRHGVCLCAGRQQCNVNSHGSWAQGCRSDALCSRQLPLCVSSECSFTAVWNLNAFVDVWRFPSVNQTICLKEVNGSGWWFDWSFARLRIPVGATATSLHHFLL